MFRNFALFSTTTAQRIKLKVVVFSPFCVARFGNMSDEGFSVGAHAVLRFGCVSFSNGI